VRAGTGEVALRMSREGQSLRARAKPG
jgi:hypothetical protein